MLTSLWVILIYFLIFFIVGTILKNNSIVDIGWGIGFVISVWIMFFYSGDYTVAKIIVNIMVSFWGLRLFYHIIKRNFGKPEDFRYQKMRKDWGKLVIPRAFLQVYLLQGIFMFFVGYAANYANIYGLNLNVWMIVGVLIWLVGYGFEVIGDAQLRKHVNNPENKGILMTKGLWKYTRHPNYFGEALLWWGIYFVILAGGAPWYLFFSPLLITLLVRYVSGVTLLEKRMQKYQGWQVYADKTSAFIPFLKK